MSPLDDLRAADRARVTELYVQHSEELLAFFRSMLPLLKGEARDLLQQTFEELLEWLDGDTSRSIKHGRGLLFTIARRRVYAFHQKRSRTIQATVNQPEDLPADHEVQRDDLEFLASLHEDRRGVLRAMRRLGPAEEGRAVCDLQLLVYLRFFAGMTETEVGDVLERPRATIAGQLRRARQALERELKALEVHEPGVARTSTTLLRDWWSEVEARANEMAHTEPDPSLPPPEESSAAS